MNFKFSRTSVQGSLTRVTPWFLIIDKLDNIVFSELSLNTDVTIDFFKNTSLNETRN